MPDTPEDDQPRSAREPVDTDAREQRDTDPHDDAAGAGRESVAQRRRGGSNRLTLILGACSLVAIIVVVVIGFVMRMHATAVPDDGYGPSTKSVATADSDGVITVSHGNPRVAIDVYVDALGPKCSTFERQFGQQMAKAVDAGSLAVRYHLVDYLNTGSASGDYSTRAYAALLAMAKYGGSRPGHFAAFYQSLWDTDTQPGTVSDGAKTDLTNAQLASLAAKAGASKAVRQRIISGAEVATAKTDAATHLTKLKSVWSALGGGDAQTPTVTHDGHLQHLNNVHWLDALLDDQ